MGGGGPNFCSERIVKHFCGKLPLTEITNVSQSVNAGHRWRGKYCDRKVPKNNHIFEYPWNLVWWQKATHISLKKISELKSDVRSCRCKNFSLKQVSGRIEGVGGPGPPGPSLWIRHCDGTTGGPSSKYEHRHCCVTFKI